MFASQQKLDNLIAFTDYNKMQLDGMVEDICAIEPLEDKWKSFGFNVIKVENGNDCDEIDKAISDAKNMSGKPTMIILNTTKGFGVTFAIKAGTSNHSMTISKELLEEGLKELGGMD